MTDKGKVIKGGFDYVEMPVQVIEISHAINPEMLLDPTIEPPECAECSICLRVPNPGSGNWIICKGDGREEGGYSSCRVVCISCLRGLKDALNDEEDI